MNLMVLSAALAAAALPVASAGHGAQVTTIAAAPANNGPEPNEPAPMPPRRLDAMASHGPRPAEPFPAPPRRVA